MKVSWYIYFIHNHCGVIVRAFWQLELMKMDSRSIVESWAITKSRTNGRHTLDVTGSEALTSDLLLCFYKVEIWRIRNNSRVSRRGEIVSLLRVGFWYTSTSPTRRGCLRGHRVEIVTGGWRPAGAGGGWWAVASQWSAHLADPTSLTSLMIYVELQAPWLIVN